MRLRILSWNLSYGYGLGSEGTARYHQASRVHFESALAGISDVIKSEKIDIALLQEVDFKSKRSHFMDQLALLSRTTDLRYHSALVSWDKFYVPFPGLKPENHFGRVKSGGGILSRFEINPIFSERLPKPRENSRLYNYFYLFRYLQIVQTAGIRICNFHLEAFSKMNRELQLVKLQNRLADFEIDLAAGDLNGFATLGDVAQGSYALTMTPEPSFPCDQPTEYLDGLILKKNGGYRLESVKTLNTGTLSDHFPVLIELSKES